MIVKVGERRATVKRVGINTDEDTGRRLALFLFALATDRPGYSEADELFTCTVEGETFDEVIRITGAREAGRRQYIFQGVFQGLSVEGSFESSGYTGSIHEVP